MKTVFLLTKKFSKFTAVCPEWDLLKDTLEAELEKATEGEQFIIQIADASRGDIRTALKKDKEENQFEGF